MLRLMLFFPSVTFGIIGAEIFPWALVYAALRLRSIPFRALPLAATIVVSLFVTIFIYEGQYTVESIRSLLAYINPILLFIVLARVQKSEVMRLAKILKYTLIAFIVLGIVQISGIIQFIDPFIKALVPRGGASGLGFGRGITLLSTEPSRAASEMVFLYAAWRTMSGDVKPKKHLLIDILFTLFVVGALKSAVGMVLILIYFFFIYRLKFILVLLPLIPIVSAMFIDTRAVQVAVDLLSKTSTHDAYQFLIDSSGFRLSSILSAYYYGLNNFFGGGLGAWPISSVNAMQAAGFSANEINYFIFHADSEFVGVRPPSYTASVALDFGLFGILCLAYLLYPYVKRALQNGDSIRPLLGLFLFNLIGYGAIGNPIPWLALMLTSRYLGAKEVFHTPDDAGCIENDGIISSLTRKMK